MIKIRLIFFYNLITLLIILLILEVIFNILPTSDSEKTYPVNKDNPYLHLIENKDLLISSGAFFEHKNIKHTNNFGYFSDIDYEVNPSNKKLITIGSSLVTANQVLNKQTFHGLINAEMNGNKQMYMLGGSNAPQSQYLAYTKFALDKFNPYALIIIIGNLDFKTSLLKNSLENSGYHYFDDLKYDCSIILNDYIPSRTKELLRNFATARYLYLNARIQSFEFSWNRQISSSNISHSEINNDNEISINCFLSELKKLTKNVPVLLVIDSMGQINRAEHVIYSDFINHSKKFLISESKKYQFEVIDLEQNFYDDFQLNRRRFEWVDDAHWNADGHRVVADAIKSSKIYKKYIQ